MCKALSLVNFISKTWFLFVMVKTPFGNDWKWKFKDDVYQRYVRSNLRRILDDIRVNGLEAPCSQSSFVATTSDAFQLDDGEYILIEELKRNGHDPRVWTPYEKGISVKTVKGFDYYGFYLKKGENNRLHIMIVEGDRFGRKLSANTESLIEHFIGPRTSQEKKKLPYEESGFGKLRREPRPSCVGNFSRLGRLVDF